MADGLIGGLVGGGLVGGRYMHLVPKELGANLRFRRRILDMARNDAAFQHVLWCMCRRDILFWCNVFGYVAEPRTEGEAGRVLPLITYGFQDEALLTLQAAIGRHDILVDKSRDMTASWDCVLACLHRWCFEDWSKFLWVSRKEELVDKPRNLKSLFAKADFFLQGLPGWLRPYGIERTYMHLYNAERSAGIDGESTNADLGSGDRVTAILLDEFAKVRVGNNGRDIITATRDVTRCRIINSTTMGMNCAYYDMKQKSNLVKLSLHWTRHPEKARGLYTSERGKLRVLDESYSFPSGYRFVLSEEDALARFGSAGYFYGDGKPRSPWYDEQCERARHPREIAQELDMDDLGSDIGFFDQAMLNEVADRDVRVPFETLKPAEFAGLLEMPDYPAKYGGELRLWCQLDGRRMPPGDRNYAIGVDVSAGSGASNSVASVVDVKTGEKVAEWAGPNCPPHIFALVVAGLGSRFKGMSAEAYVIWDAGGPGVTFGHVLVEEVGYRNIYWKTDEFNMNKRVTDRPGFWMSAMAKDALLREYAADWEARRYINRSYWSVEEARQYVYLPSRRISSSLGSNPDDPSGAGANHGDRVIADALSNMGRKRCPSVTDSPVDAPYGSLAWARQQPEFSQETVRERFLSW